SEPTTGNFVLLLVMAWSPPAHNAGNVRVSAPGDYATFNSNHTPDGTRAFLDKDCHALKAIGGCQQIADYFAGTGSPRDLPDFCGLLPVIVGTAPLCVVHPGPSPQYPIYSTWVKFERFLGCGSRRNSDRCCGTATLPMLLGEYGD